MEQNNGPQTTEFWLTMVALLFATIFVFTNKLTIDQWVTLVSVLVPAYGISRGISKIGK